MKEVQNTILIVIRLSVISLALLVSDIHTSDAQELIFPTEFTSGFNPFEEADSLADIYRTIPSENRQFRATRKAQWAEKHDRFRLALESWREVEMQAGPGIVPNNRIAQLNRKATIEESRLLLPKIRFEKSSLLVLILVIVILYSAFSMIILLVVILLHRNQMEREARIRQGLKETYQSLLMDYLFDETGNNEVPEKLNSVAGNRFRRVILMDEMRDLTVNLSGDAADKLRGLYYKLNLHEDSKNKAMNRKWHIKIKGFRELAFMNIKEANDEIVRCLHSNNSILRMEAQLAMVRLNDDDRFSFLDQLQRPLTRWEQMNVYEMIVSHNLEVPDFERWTNSENRTVVLFSLRMIRIFKQRKSWEKVASLLSSADQEIRKTSVNVLGELRIKQAVPYLKGHYKYEVYENQLEIVKSLSKIADESVAGFLVKVIDKEDDVQLQIEAAKALRDMGAGGENALKKLMNSDYKNYMIIIKHVLDKRI